MPKHRHRALWSLGPRRFSAGIIAGAAFSHSQGQKQRSGQAWLGSGLRRFADSTLRRGLFGLATTSGLMRRRQGLTRSADLGGYRTVPVTNCSLWD
jgi:hypothetical protein